MAANASCIPRTAGKKKNKPTLSPASGQVGVGSGAGAGASAGTQPRGGEGLGATVLDHGATRGGMEALNTRLGPEGFRVPSEDPRFAHELQRLQTLG